MFNIEEIQKILPQRYPFLLIDRILELDEGRKVVAVKNISINEDFFTGHFPGNPVMPGALIIEAMAQASIALFYSSNNRAGNKEKQYLLGTVKARFLNPVFPGDQLKITVEPVKIISTGAIVNAVAEVSGKVACQAELGFSVK
jgi:3-hydroxyacyl-[acyl-carrier-protein] dehydratase